MIKRLIMNAAALLALMTPAMALTTLPASAALDSRDAACKGIGLTGGECDGTAAGNRISGVVRTIVNLLSVVVGMVVVIMIIISGFKYVTSGGDTSKVASAKSTLVYAIIGLIIVVLAQFIVHFVLTNV